jgi:outer membrane protein assembly factor BamB
MTSDPRGPGDIRNGSLGRRDVLKAAGASVIVSSAITAGQADSHPPEGPTVYIGSFDSALHAIDARTGEQHWALDEGTGTSSAPVVVDGTAYVGSEAGTVYAVDAVTKDTVWAFDDPDGTIQSSPTVLDGTVYVGGPDGTVYALDADSGDVVWTFEEPSNAVNSSPAVTDDLVFVGADDTTLYAIDTRTGEHVWSFEEPDARVSSSPTVSDGTVFVGAADETVYAVDALSGTLEWQFEEPDFEVLASPVVVDDTVYVQADYLFAVDAETGDHEWQFETGPTMATPTVHDGFVYGTAEPGMYVVDTETGELDWYVDPLADDAVYSSPTVYDGMVYLSPGIEAVAAVSISEEEYDWERGLPTQSSPTVVDDPDGGDSIGTRARLGVLGHHHTWADGITLAVSRGEVSGTVTTESGEPIEGVPVAFRRDGETVGTATTDSDGAFTAELRADRTYRVVVDAEWLEAFETDLTVTEDATQELEISVARVAPADVFGRVTLDRTAVTPGGDDPLVRVRVEAAEEVVVTASYEADGETQRVEYPLDDIGEGLWEGPVTVPDGLSVGTWVSLSVTARNGPTRVALDGYTNEYVLETTDIGFHVVDSVMKVALVLTRFADAEPYDEDDAADWVFARAHDLNYCYSSERGSMGAVGFNVVPVWNDLDGYQLPKRAEDYVQQYEPEEAVDTVIDDTRAVVRSEGTVDLDAFDVWVTTHRGRSRGGPKLQDSSDGIAGKYLDGAVYAPGAVSTEYAHYETWLHELGHSYGLDHLNEYGDIRDLCFMGGGGARDEADELPIHPTPPASTPIRISQTLDLMMSDPFESHGNWLDVIEAPIDDAWEQREQSVTDLTAYERNDEIAVYTHGDVTYVVESRAFLGNHRFLGWKWEEGTGGAIVYRHERTDGGDSSGDEAHSISVLQREEGGEHGPWYVLTDPDEDGQLRDSPAAGLDYELVFELREHHTDGVDLQVRKGTVEGRRCTLTQRISLPDSLELPFAAPFTRPTLDLQAVDADGRRVGMNDGEYVNEIPGARASGRRIGGMEWIVVPEDTEVEFQVSGADLERFVEDLRDIGVIESDEESEQVRDSMRGEYELGVTTYSDDSELVVENGVTTVTNVERTTEQGELDPGEEASVTVGPTPSGSVEDENGGSDESGSDDGLFGGGDGASDASDDGGPLGVDVETAVAGGVVTASLLYLAARMLSDGDDGY